MRYFVQVSTLLAVLSGAVQAQPSNGYVFFAPGGVTCCSHTAMTLQFGGGVDGIIGKGVGVGAEVGAVGPRQHYTDGVVGIFSPNGSYHFVRGQNVKVDPFVTAGYSLLFRSGHANLFNFGGGVNYWFHRRLGARFEVRDHVYTSDGTLHYWGFRIGLTCALSRN